MATSHAYSIIVPVYNGSQTLKELLERLKIVFEQLSSPFEVIFVDDCSSDTSWQVLTEIQRQNSFVKIYQLQNNCGQHTATLCGVLKASNNSIITIDDDLQIPPEEILKLIEKKKQTNARLVYGHFVNKRQSGYKNIGRRILFFIMRRMLEDFTYASSFRIFDKALVNEIDTSYRKYYTLDVSLILQKPKIAFADVQHHTRQQGKSGYKFRYLMGFVASYFINYTYLPVRLMLLGGVIIAMLGFIFGMIFFKNTGNYFFGSIMLCCTGLIIIALSLFTEYFARYMQANSSRQLFVIKQRNE